MKKIDAIVRTSRLDDIVNRLFLVGVTGMTFAEAYGLSSSAVTASMSRGRRLEVPAAPRYQVSIVVADADAAHVVNAIIHAARTEAAGDGLVTVTDVLGVMRIRTGEIDDDAV
jgi:nitrogen regulatory protein P-II 1